MEELKDCSFSPATGRGPANGPRGAVAGLPVGERLYAVAQYRQWRQLSGHRGGALGAAGSPIVGGTAVAAAGEDKDVQECTFTPRINRQANERQLDACTWR
jgi:hypothetical protein